MTATAEHATTTTPADPLASGHPLHRRRLSSQTLAVLRGYLSVMANGGATHVPIAGIHDILAGRAPHDPFLDHDPIGESYRAANRRRAWDGNR